MSLLNHLRNPDLRNVAVYAIATALAALLTLVLTRVLWRGLTPNDFGTWALVDPMLLPGASLILFGVDHAIVKQLRVDRVSLRLVTGTLLASTLPATAVSLLIAGLIAQLVFRLAWTDALLLTLAGEALVLMVQTALRATGAVYGFAAVLLSRNLLYLSVLIYVGFFSARPLSIGLVFGARGGCVLLVSLLALAVLRPEPRFHGRRYRDAVRYGFPLLLTSFIFALTDMTDRWFLAEFTGMIEVGVYALHLKLAAILGQAIVVPFGLWFAPERFRRLDDPDGGRRFFIRTALVLTLICSYLAGGVWLSRDLLLSWIAPGIMASASVLACCLGAVLCLALSQALNVGLLLPGHTGKNAICTLFAVAASVVACLILVPSFGINGAALSRLLGGLVLVYVTAVWSRRVFPVAFATAAMLLAVAVSMAAAVSIDALAAGPGLPALSVALIAWTAASSAISAGIWFGCGQDG